MKGKRGGGGGRLVVFLLRDDDWNTFLFVACNKFHCKITMEARIGGLT